MSAAAFIVYRKRRFMRTNVEVSNCQSKLQFKKVDERKNSISNYTFFGFPKNYFSGCVQPAIENIRFRK